MDDPSAHAPADCAIDPHSRSGPDALLEDIDEVGLPDGPDGDPYDAPAFQPEPPSVTTIVIAHALISAVIFFVLLTVAMLVSFIINGRRGVWLAAGRWPWMLFISLIAATVAAAFALWRTRCMRRSSPQ
jgi:hypothetical protein